MITRAALWERYRGDAIEEVVLEMERNGFAIDVPFCNEQAARAAEDEEESLSKLRHWLIERGVASEHPDDIWSSPKQLGALLHDVLRYPPSPIWKRGRVRIDKGERKTDEKALEWIRNRVPVDHRRGLDELVRLRRVRGCIKYLRKLPQFVAPDGLVHPVCGPAGDGDDRVGTITGRLGMKNPEAQQIPASKVKDPYRIRRAFVAPPGHTLVGGDFTALEVVVLAHIMVDLFGDHQLAEMVAPDAPDFHAMNARRVFQVLGWKVNGIPVGDYPIEAFVKDSGASVPGCVVLRQMIKEVFYGWCYGKGSFGFATSLKGEDDEPIGEERAEQVVTGFLSVIPALPKYQGWCWDFIMKFKGMIGLGGRWCDLRELVEGDDWQKKRAHRIALNFPCQESAAAIMGAAMVKVAHDENLRRRGVLVQLQVHDEAIYRCPSSENIEEVRGAIERHMRGAFPLHVPLQAKVGVGSTWEELK